MNTTEKVITKRVYNTPAIELISLDNEISLILGSSPPIGPGETNNNSVPEYFNNDPYRNKA